MKKLWLFAVVAALAAGAAGCGGGGASGDVTGDLKSVTVKSSTSTGDFTPSVIAGLGTGGTLKFTIAGVDADGDGTIDTPTLSGVKASTGALAMVLKAVDDTDVNCGDEVPIGEGTTEDKYDIGISLDTTGSMGNAAGILAERVASFATALVSGGVDAQFAGITLGDAFATKKSSGSAYDDVVSVGTLGDPPSWDSDERPDTGTALLGDAAMATFFAKVKDVVGSGSGGSGGTENYLGALQFLTSNVVPRSGSIRVLISIGDQCAYTPETAGEDGIVAPFLPPDPTSFAAGLAGNAIVHVISRPEDYIGCAGGNYYNMKGLSDATGGQFVDIGNCSSADTCNVDLTTLPITGAILGGVNVECNGLTSFYGAAGDYTFDLTITAGGKTAITRMILGLGW